FARAFFRLRLLQSAILLVVLFFGFHFSSVWPKNKTKRCVQSWPFAVDGHWPLAATRFNWIPQSHGPVLISLTLLCPNASVRFSRSRRWSSSWCFNVSLTDSNVWKLDCQFTLESPD